MKRWAGRIVIAVALLVAGYFAGHHSVPVVHAQGGGSIPKAWGKCIGAAGERLIFEDGNGTLRMVVYDTGQLAATFGRN
jgi:hypothetical protein